MKLEIGSQSYGFRLNRMVELKEIGGILYELVHERTGMKLAWLKRDDDNKSFAITFTTLPENDTGVFHILEHSVLGGSEHYPVKEPFLELLKSSMNTFLNAMTFPDKTMYPVSSRNEKDFINLVRIYLDGVFLPSIYQKEEIFCQEGWHYEFDEQGKPSYKGVVFNEMKGAFADADELEDMAITSALFPDTPYSYCSGGDPTKIPDLTYEMFLDSHRRFYSPSNSFVWLDGDLNLDAVLAIIDQEYLVHFEKTERIAPPAFQKPVNAGTKTVEYEIAPTESLEGKTKLAFSSVIGTFREREKINAMQILADVLCGGNQAPLTKAVLSKGLAEDVTLAVRDGVSQPYACLEVSNLKAENLEAVETLVQETLRGIVHDGLNREELEATMANMEFKMRERDYGSFPMGLANGMIAMDSWLYGGAPEDNLEVGDLFTVLHKKMDEGYFEKLIDEILLSNGHSCKVVMVPSHEAGEQRRKAEEERLSGEVAAMSDSVKESLIAKQKKIQSWQESEDTPEQLATIPHLKIQDIDTQPEFLPTEALNIGNTTVLYHAVNTNGIIYGRLYFDLSGLSKEELPVAGFLTDLLGELDTEEHTAEEIARTTRLILGSLDFGIGTYDLGDGLMKFTVSFSVLEANLKPALAHIEEILTKTKFDDETAILDILRQSKQGAMQSFIMGGNRAAMGRVAAYTSACAAKDEYLRGFEYYQWLKNSEKSNTVPAPQLKQLLHWMVNRNAMTVSVTYSRREIAEETAKIALAMIPEGSGEVKTGVVLPLGVRKEGIVIPADIAFAVRGSELYPEGGEITGVVGLANKILGLSYLWNVIRVQGGAYGAGISARRKGYVFCYSYRDPNGAQSLEKYLGCGEFLRNFCSSGPDLTDFIIGTVSDGSPILTPRAKGATADGMYFEQVTWEARCQRRKELLEATKEQLLAYADLLDQAMNRSGICVIGGSNQMKSLNLDTMLEI